MNLRHWQENAKSITDRVARSDEKLVIVNACVGSGKTFVAENAFGDFIKLHKSEKTVQIFVTPRIRLCDQQANSIIKTLENVYNLTENKDFSLVQVDCTKNEFNWRNSYLSGNHIIFVICDESLFGYDPAINNAKISRWKQWLNNFENWKSQDYKFGFAVFDEAHNYENINDKIIGTAESADVFFKVMLLSGTPSAFQKDLTKQYKNAVCKCSPKVAIDNKWIKEPILNLVNGTTNQWPQAIITVLNREISLCEKEVFTPRIMINCNGIDEIKNLIELPYFKENMGKKFHFITLHSNKSYVDNNEIKNVTPTIDGKEVSSDEAFKKIECIDANTAFEDNLPILVAQVQMLGEGINVTSFNACLTSTNSDKTAMQQIGRIIRNYKKDNVTKVDNGHANVYVLIDNANSLANLLNNLEEYDLTDDCYRWGDKIDLFNSSGLEINSENISELNKMNWVPINPNEELDIIVAYNKMHKKSRVNILERFFRNKDNNNDGIADIEELELLIKKLSETGILKMFTNKQFNYNSEVAKRKKLFSTEKTEKNKENKKSKSEKPITEEILLTWLDEIYNVLHANKNQELKDIWYKDKDYSLFLALIFLNDDIVKFLSTHLSEELKKWLSR